MDFNSISMVLCKFVSTPVVTPCHSMSVGYGREREGVGGNRRESDTHYSPLCGGIVRLVRAPACYAGGRGFESRRSRQFLRTAEPSAVSELFRRIARASSMRTLTSQLRKAPSYSKYGGLRDALRQQFFRLGALSPHRQAHGKRRSEATDNCVRTAGQISTDLLVLFSR